MKALIVVLVLVVLLVIYGGATFNGLIRRRNLAEEAWRQIDVELKRRHDLIPNLVETVKGYASHERGTLEDVMRARSAAMNGSPTPVQAAQSEGQLTQALGRLMAVAEAYPDLKANQGFVALQGELSSTEDRIAAGRRYYNATVRELNTRVQSVPSNVVAGLAHVSTMDYFEAEETAREVPSVTFGGSQPALQGPAGSFGGSSPTPAYPPATTPPQGPLASGPQDTL